jgi:BNR/Asp-box repeat
VPEPRDELDTWLGVQVQPLLPPPGTFERASRQARRLRTRRALLAAAGALAVAAIAAVAVPQLVIPALGTGRQASATGGLSSAAAVPRHPATGMAGSPPAPATAGPPVPAVATAPPPQSVTFVGAATGWVMGQSLPAGQCDQPAAPACIVLRRTDSGGATWRTVHPPPAHGPNGPTGVSQIRFLTRSDGWAFGPQLWATHNAGRTWTQVATGGLRVTALEARGRRVFAVWARCTGTGAGFASHCTSFTVYSSPAGSDAWTPALSPVAAGPAGGAASLLLTGTTAYLLSPAGSLFAGPLTGATLQSIPQATGTAAAEPRTPPCPAGSPQPGGQPSGALLAAGPPSSLDLLCAGTSAGGPQRKTIYASSDGGQTWRRTGQAPATGTAWFLSASPSGALVLATSVGIEVSTDGGTTWSAAGGTMPPGGFAYVGMTTGKQGVAVPAGPDQHSVWLTYDGGHTWQPSPAGG